MKYANSTNSISSLVSTYNVSTNSSYEELVSKIFSCNIVLVLTDNAKQFVKNCFGTTTFCSVLNQFASISNLHLTIRDLNGHNAYALNNVRFRFFDIDQFKNRPNGAQIKKLHNDIISSMSNSYLMKNENEEESLNCETPWYDLWKNVFIDTFEPSEHDFIGTNCGCFFVISKVELPRYKVIFENLCTMVKQNSTLRFIQPDFVRYFIVLSDQILEPLSPNSDEFTKTCQSLKLDFPNSFVFYIEVNNVNNLKNTLSESELRTINDEMSQNEFSNDTTAINELLSDPLSQLNIESNRENSKFYQELQSQRQQSQNSASTNSLQSRDIICDWLSHLSINDHKKEVLDSVSKTIDFMLREFISKFLISWAEKQIKILGELIAQRKGFRKSIFSATKSLLSNMSSSTVNLTKSLSGASSSGVIYIPDAQEMQQRKLADICMIFNIYEMAHNLYYAARKDFQSESAWIYYAGASEMSAVSSYFLHKYQHNHIEQAIITYMDTCGSVNLATRATILATELLCQLNRLNDAANLYIRLTGDDSDLRSALFLEQASKCYLSISPKISTSSQVILNATEKLSNNDTASNFGSRYRKAVFHYILAGHRYNRCGLKHFALFCYRRYNYPNWESASTHVNLTVAKLFLSIASSNNKKQAEYYRQGLEIFCKYSYQQAFFNELLWEFKKYKSTNLQELPLSLNDLLQSNLNIIDLPYIDKFQIISPDSIRISETLPFGKKHLRTSCFVNEEVQLMLTIYAPFEFIISNIVLIPDKCDDLKLISYPEKITLKNNEKTNLILKFCSLTESEFTFTGIQYEIDNIIFKKMFTNKMKRSMAFNSIKTLPLIKFNIHFVELDLDTSQCLNESEKPNLIVIPKKVYGSEILTLNINLNTAAERSEFSSVQLNTNVKDFYYWKNIEDESRNHSNQYFINDLSQPLNLSMQIPPNCTQYEVFFRLIYTYQDGKCRTVFREMRFEVIPCIQLEILCEQVINIQNLSMNKSLAVYDVMAEESNEMANIPYFLIPPNISAHLLMKKTFIPWILYGNNIENNNRHGKINFKN